MSKPAVIVLVCLGLALAAMNLLNGTSRVACFPEKDQWKRSAEEPEAIRIPFTCEMDRLQAIHLCLPEAFKRRPLELVLRKDGVEAPGRLIPQEKRTLRSKRAYRLDREMEKCRGESLELEIRFMDGPVLKDSKEEELFGRLGLIFCHGQDFSRTASNFAFLKPIPRALPIAGGLFLLFLIMSAALLRRVKGT